MAKPILPIDENANAIPVAAFRRGAGAHAIASSGSSARNSIAFDGDTRIVSIYATENVYVEFGDSTVTASSSNHFFPSGIYYDVHVPPAVTHLAVLQVSAAGTVYVSEKE